jgi:hypothetical protein
MEKRMDEPGFVEFMRWTGKRMDEPGFIGFMDEWRSEFLNQDL